MMLFPILLGDMSGVFAVFQSWETSPGCHDFPEKTKSGLAMTLASTLSSYGCTPLCPEGLFTSSLFRSSLPGLFCTEDKSSLSLNENPHWNQDKWRKWEDLVSFWKYSMASLCVTFNTKMALYTMSLPLFFGVNPALLWNRRAKGKVYVSLCKKEKLLKSKEVSWQPPGFLYTQWKRGLEHRWLLQRITVPWTLFCCGPPLWTYVSPSKWREHNFCDLMSKSCHPSAIPRRTKNVLTSNQ